MRFEGDVCSLLGKLLLCWGREEQRHRAWWQPGPGEMLCLANEAKLNSKPSLYG